MATTSLFQRRPLPDAQPGENAALGQSFGTFHLTLIGLSSSFRCLLLFSFFLAVDVTGPSACVTFLLGGLMSVFYGLCFIDLASHHPSSGSIYTYTFCAMGEVVAFIVGWTALCDLLLQAALLAKAASSSLDLMMDGNISSFLLHHGGALGGMPPANFTAAAPAILSETLDPLAALLLLLLGLLLLLDTRVSITTNGAISCLLLGAIFAVFTACFVVGDSANFSRAFFVHGASGFRRALALSPPCFAFFEALSVSSEEAQRPGHDLPVASALSLGLTTGLLAMAGAAAGFLQPRDATTFAAAFKEADHHALFLFAASVTLVASAAGASVSLFLASRYLFAMARGGSLPSGLTRVLHSTKAPWAAVTVSFVSASGAALLLHQRLLASVCNVSTAVTVVAISVSTLILRYLPDEPGKLPLRPALARILEARQGSDWLRQRSFFKASLVLLIVSLVVALFFLERLKVPFIGSLFTVAAVAAFGVLWLYEPVSQEGAVRARGLPLLCAASALISAALVFEMSIAAVFRLFVLTFLGLVMFAAKKLTGQRSEEYNQLEGENAADAERFERTDAVRKTM